MGANEDLEPSRSFHIANYINVQSLKQSEPDYDNQAMGANGDSDISLTSQITLIIRCIHSILHKFVYSGVYPCNNVVVVLSYKPDVSEESKVTVSINITIFITIKAWEN